jgi:glyoxylase-like metal-dependent hydrolase (beta-lactamase superfamily II)
MLRALRIAGGVTAVLLIGLAGVILAGQRGAPVPARADAAIDLAALRALGRSRGGELPTAVNALVVARGELPRGAVIAGGSWLERVPCSYASFQIAYGDGGSLVVDAPYQERDASANDAPALRALEEGIARASALLLTHTHADHVLGLARSPRYDELKAKLTWTRAQRDDPEHGVRAFPLASPPGTATPLAYEGSAVFAPGVVLLAAPGHSRDGQMIYVELASGAQLLLVGDVVWSMDNIRELTTRPRIVGGTLVRGDENRVAQQIRALHDLLESSPGVELVVSHDARRLDEQIAAGVLGNGFRS